MSLHSDASSDGFNNDAIDVEKAFQLISWINKPRHYAQEGYGGTSQTYRGVFLCFFLCVVTLKILVLPQF